MGMNDLESRLSAAFRSEADELSAAVDLPRAAVELESRLDRLERDRHRRTWVIGIAAVAAVALAVILGVRLATPHVDTEPVSPTTSYTSQGFVVPFTADFPDWATAQVPVTANRRIVWQSDQCWRDCSAGNDAKLVVMAPQVAFGATAQDRLVIPSAQGYLDHLQALTDAHLITVSDMHSTTVAGHAATVLDVVATTTVAGALGCEGSGTGDPAEPSCWSLVAGTHLRLAVITADTQPYYGSGAVTPPLLVMVRADGGSAQLPTYVADLDHLLATMQIPAPQAPTYTSPSSLMPFSIALPSWATAARPAMAPSGRLVTWETSCEPTGPSLAADCADPPRVFAVMSPVGSDGVDPIGTVPDQRGVSLLGSFTALLVDGRPAQVATVTVAQEVPGALGCDAPASCSGLAAGTTVRVAEITENGKPLLVVWQSWATGSPGSDNLEADFDAALLSIRFGR
jgi:hypothetical protein